MPGGDLDRTGGSARRGRRPQNSSFKEFIVPRNLLEAWDDERDLVRREQRLALALTKAKAEADLLHQS